MTAPPPRGLSRRQFLTGAAAAAGSVVVGPTIWTQAARASTPAAGLHLTYGADPRRMMRVSWSTVGAVRGAVLEYGLDQGFGQTVVPVDLGAPGVTTRYHHALIDGLAPGTDYVYRIRHEGSADEHGRFRTAPAAAKPFRFATFGDMGVSSGAVDNLRELVLADPAFCFVVGDLCYADLSGGTGVSALPHNPTVWDTWFEQIRPNAAGTPWMPTVGNHEMERGNGELGYDGYLARIMLPGNGAPGGPVTYSYRYGNVGFVALDGNDASYEITQNNDYLGPAQDAWLATTLQALRADDAIDFIVVGFHNCMYCSNAFHGSDGGNRRRWEAIFDAHGVDLVVNGHNHCYERTHPVRNGQPVSEVPDRSSFDSSIGTTYLTVGGGGQAEYPTSAHPVSYVVQERVPGTYGGIRVPETALWSASRFLEHSIAIVDVTPRDRHGVATMTVRGRPKTGGDDVDRVTLVRTTPPMRR